ncbi:membrane-bound lytic murein transglycosylase MltF [Thiohalorhabdus methylotrophus]|uniref:Membrane-bound lytic murein transglycosylase F n=1 Tax=Thiohalorhabdus methylotrophus TaxID=3242694 RepID=A0ABV4TYT1_9GAMM
MGFRIYHFLVLSCFLLAACDDRPAEQSSARSLEEIKASGKLVVLTRNAPTTWYIDRDGEAAGPEYEMARDFAEHLGVEAEFKLRPSLGAILDSLQEGAGDLAAAGLTPTDQRRKHFRFGPGYQDVTQQVVCRRDNVQPERVADLAGLDLAVVADSSYAERLRALEPEHPELRWREIPETSTEELLQSVWKREIDCTVADSTIVDINRRYFPELSAPFNLTREQSLAWALPASSADLERAVAEWLEAYRADNRLSRLQEKYYGFFEVFDYVDTRVYMRRIDRRFPKFRSYFRQAAEKHDLPYTLIAAQGYQESHWRANARSPTGVRGIMMLTLRTARSLGVENRLDPKQSIFGGAKYLARMKKRFSDEVTEPDRTWLALAAYNVGRGHLHDAQKLARKKGLSPYRWRSMKKVLPLLADKDYYRDLKYGYARGTEPVRYVRRIREYRHVLKNEMRQREARAGGGG